MAWRRLLVLLLVVVAALVGCGGDDDDDDDASPSSGGHDQAHDAAGNPCAEGGEAPPSEEPADGAIEVDVTARDYEFVGTDVIASTGTYAITLSNDGTELHEMVLLRVDDSESRSIEEMLLADDQPDTLIDVAFGFACPGSSMTFNADLPEPGRYVAVCFIPTGTTPETDAETLEHAEGAPHAVNGMFVELDLG